MEAPIATVQRPAGTIIGGKYRIERLLGEGGMGAVYESTPLAGGSRVAIKILHEEMSSNPDVVARFLAEGDVCRKLDHPGILRVFDMGNEAGTPYLVMELLQGRALIDYTEHGQRLPVNFAVTVCAGVLHALEYAHGRGVIHRDLKPENVYLCAGANGQYHAKLLDFGIARAIDAAGGARRRTATGVLLGTPGYMSPEQVKSARNVDHRADLWAVGVMFYEMVTAAVAFPSDGDDPNNIWGLISAVLTKEPVPISTYDPHLVTFDPFIKRALHKDIEQRYQSAKEMSDDLLAISRGEAPRPSQVAQKPGAFTAENRAYPINSRGELPAIPAMAGGADPNATVMSPEVADVLRTVPSGGAGAAASLGGTVPMTGSPISAAQARASLERTALASDPVGGTVLTPGGASPMGTLQSGAAAAPGDLGSTVLAPSGGAPLGTAPSGFGPPVKVTPAAAAPVIPPNAPASHAEAGGGGMAMWIALGVVLIAGLGAAVYWVLH
jgi:serine/threonine-protein kinase